MKGFTTVQKICSMKQVVIYQTNERKCMPAITICILSVKSLFTRTAQTLPISRKNGTRTTHHYTANLCYGKVAK